LSRMTCTGIKGASIPLVCAFRTCFCMGTGAAGRRMLNTITHFCNYIMNSVNLLNNSTECCAGRLHHLLQHKQRTRVFCPLSVFYIRLLKREINISLNTFSVQGEALPFFCSYMLSLSSREYSLCFVMACFFSCLSANRLVFVIEVGCFL